MSDCPSPPATLGALPAEPGCYRYDWSSMAPSTAAIASVAAAAGRAPTDIPPLSGRVDPDALDALLDPDGPTAAGGPVSISFPDASYEVTVTRGGDLSLEPDPPAGP